MGFDPGEAHILSFINSRNGQVLSKKFMASRCFDQIPHQVVIDLLQERIEDESFLDLIRKFLTNRITTTDDIDLRNKAIGIPQGAVLSPILMNVVLHPFSFCVRNIYYGRVADDQTIGITGNNDEAAWEIINQIKAFLQQNLGDMQVRAKIIQESGTLLGMNLV